MTEEIQNDIIDPENEVEEAVPEMPRRIRITYIISIAFLSFTIIDSIFQFSTFHAWQILADASGMFLGVIALIVSALSYTKNKRRADSLIPVAIFVTYALGDLFLENVTVYNLVSGVIIFLITYFIFRPDNLRFWFRATLVYAVSVIIFSQINIFDRFDITNSESWKISLPIFTIVITILLLWQVFSNTHVRTIQTRLLIILIGIGLVPTILTSAASALIVYQRDITQAEGNLNTVLNFRTEQITAWQNQVSSTFQILQQNGTFVDDVDFILNYTPTASYEASLREEIGNFLSTYSGEGTNFLELSIANLNGLVVVSTKPDKEGVSYAADPLFVNGASNLYNSPLTLNYTTKEIEYSISQPLYNAEMKEIGVLIARVYTNELTTLMQAKLGTDTRKSYLVSARQILLTPILQQANATAGRMVSLSFIGGGEQEDTNLSMANFHTYTNSLGENVIGVYQFIAPLQTYIVIEQNEAEAFQTLQLNLITNGSLTVLTLIAIIIVSIRSTRNISIPLVKITEEAAQVTRKELDLIEPIDRYDEIGQLSQSLSTMTKELIQTTTNLENTVAERTKMLERRAAYLQTTSEISKALTGIYNLEDLLNTVAFLISENFGFYHVGIFLLDAENEYAELKASNSEGGWRMLARNHKLKVGEQGIVGFVTGSGLPRIQQQVKGEESVHYNNPDLPLTKSEMALPLKAGNEIFGALDVQDTEEAAFSDEDVSALQALADAVAVAIQNTRLVQQLQENLETERRMYGDLTSASWRSLLAAAKATPAFRSDPHGIQTVTENSSPLAQKAVQLGQSEIELSKDITGNHTAAIPISVRGGAVVAVIETQKPAANGPWTTEEITILESVGAELGMAIENARLFEESQKTAQRERISANLSSKIWASTDVENILQTTIRELGNALNISYGTIKLKLAEEQQSNGNLDGVDLE